MEHTDTRTSTSPPSAAIVAGIGGLVALIGVFLDWASVTSSFEGGGFAGQNVGASGISHWTGILALAAAMVALAAAIGIVVLQEPSTRRMAAMGATGAGAMAFLMAMLAIFMSETIALGGVPGGRQAMEFARQLAEQLGLQGFGIDTGPGIGVFVTAIGGAVAALGGFMALRRAGSPRTVPPEPPATPSSHEGGESEGPATTA